MLKYQEFLSDSLLESLVNEAALYYTKEFKDKLYSLSSKSEIAKDLIFAEYTEIKPDMTVISLGSQSGNIKFFQMNNFLSVMKKYFKTKLEKTWDSNMDKWLEMYLKKIENGELSQSDLAIIWKDPEVGLQDARSRVETSIGRFINKLFPNKYTSEEIEKFVNHFKGTEVETEKFELVTGQDIIKWYNQDNYKEINGELGQSCMRYTRCKDYFGIYTENPDVCQLLIYREHDKISGRAIIWKVSGYHDVEYFMDRVYTINDAVKEMFNEWSDKKGYLRKYRSGNSFLREFILNGKQILDDYDITVQLTNWKFKKYPYMDTFKMLDIDSGKMKNDDDTSQPGHYIMEHTDGGFDDTSGKYSEWYGCTIPEQDAIYSYPLGDYIRRSQGVEVIYGRYDGWYPEDYDYLVRDPFRGWLHEDDAVYSDYYGEHVYREDATEVVVHFEFRLSNGRIYYDSQTVSSQDSDIIDVYSLDCYDWMKNKRLEDLEISTDILGYSNVTNKYYFDDYVISVYKTELGNLSEVDAQLFGVEYKSSFSHKTDIMAYNYDIEDKNSMKKKLEDKIKELEYSLSGQQTKLKFSQAQDEMITSKQTSLLEKFKTRLSELKLFL